MGKFGRTQIQTSTSFSSEKKKYFSNFWGVLYILPTCFIGVLTKLSQKIDQFLDPPGHAFGQILGLFGGARVFFGSNVPRALLIDPRKWLVDAPK